jgi:hypothetical protein
MAEDKCRREKSSVTRISAGSTARIGVTSRTASVPSSTQRYIERMSDKRPKGAIFTFWPDGRLRPSHPFFEESSMSSTRFKASLARRPSPAMPGPGVQSGSSTVAQSMIERAAKLACVVAASAAY